jgi:hypothetical protein
MSGSYYSLPFFTFSFRCNYGANTLNTSDTPAKTDASDAIYGTNGTQYPHLYYAGHTGYNPKRLLISGFRVPTGGMYSSPWWITIHVAVTRPPPTIFGGSDPGFRPVVLIKVQLRIVISRTPNTSSSADASTPNAAHQRIFSTHPDWVLSRYSPIRSMPTAFLAWVMPYGLFRCDSRDA